MHSDINPVRWIFRSRPPEYRLKIPTVEWEAPEGDSALLFDGSSPGD